MAVDVVIQATAEADQPSLALIERAKAGDASAFERILETRFWRLSRLALSITTNQPDADDALQNGCLRAWRELPQLRDLSRFDVWLWRIVVNACRDVLRGRRRVTVHEIAIEDDRAGGRELEGLSGAFESISDTDLIRRAFGRLEVDRRTILILHHVDERPIGDIARILGIPEGTAKWRLHAARRSLEKALERERR